MTEKARRGVSPSAIKILVCCHKQCDLPENPDGIFLPVQAGAALSEKRLVYGGREMARDDQVNGGPCDNISAKNRNYCELTALYWAWKNLDKIAPGTEYVGLNHYRRYFSFDKKNYFDDAVILPENQAASYKVNLPKLCGYLRKYDLITARRRRYPFNLKTDYGNCHVSDDMRRLLIIIHELTPEYDIAAVSALICDNRLAHYNMTVIGRSEFNSYCEWLFKILGECEREINIGHYGAVQSRIFGYMAERLFNVWILKNRKKVKRLNVLKYSDEPHRKFPLLQISQLVIMIRNEISFFFNKPIRSAESYYARMKDKLYDRKQVE